MRQALEYLWRVRQFDIVSAAIEMQCAGCARAFSAASTAKPTRHRSLIRGREEQAFQRSAGVLRGRSAPS